MARMRGLGITREKTFPIRLTVKERTDLQRQARATGLSVSDYVRCRIFGVAFETFGGKTPREKANPTPTPVPANPTP